MTSLTIQLDPDFIEEAVFLYAGKGPAPAVLVKAFHEAREEIYAQPSGEKRDQAFRIFYEEYFARFGLEAIFENIVSEFPLLAGAGVVIYVKKVAAGKWEESELYVDGGMRTVYIGLQAIRILEREFLESFLRSELMRVCDMLDPAFQYSPHPFAEGGEVEREHIKNRFRLLWDIYVDSRLKKRGCRPLGCPESHREEFKKVFPSLSEPQRQALFSRLQNSEGLSQGDLLNLAACLPSV